MSCEITFVSRMIIGQTLGLGAWRRVVAPQVRARQTLQIVDGWPPPGSPWPARGRLELNAKSPWPPPPSNVRDGQLGPSTGPWFSRQVVELSRSPYVRHTVADQGGGILGCRVPPFAKNAKDGAPIMSVARAFRNRPNYPLTKSPDYQISSPPARPFPILLQSRFRFIHEGRLLSQ